MKVTTELIKAAYECHLLRSSEGHVPSPRLKDLAEFVNTEMPGYRAFLRETSCRKETKASGMRYFTGGGSRTYTGYVLTVIGKEGKEVLRHNSTETYRCNRDVVEFIFNELRGSK